MPLSYSAAAADRSVESRQKELLRTRLVRHPTDGDGGRPPQNLRSLVLSYQNAVHTRKPLIGSIYSSIFRYMDFQWDQTKSAANFEERGFDFEFATLIFDGPTLERPDTRKDYGEDRVIAIGTADGICLTVVYTDRAAGGRQVRRIISARRSSQREREAYEQAYEG